jgi:hypothetical protein
MKKYAEILVETSVIRNIFEWPFDDIEPEFNPNVLIAVDITDLDPMPEIGQEWNLHNA